MTQTISEANTTSPDLIEKASRSFLRCLSLVVFVAFPSFYASRASHLDAIFRLHSTIVITRDPQTPSNLSGLGGSHASIEGTWAVYLNARVAEWKVVFTLACVLVGLSLTIFQIPQAANDPFTYVFASLTQCRAFAGLVYGIILHVYFESEYTHTGRFAMVWWQNAVESKDNIWNTWVMLSLPAASTLWALLCYLLTMLSFFFRPTTLTPNDHPMPIALTVVLQAIITVSTLSDFICFAYIWITLKEYREKYHATHDEV